MCKLSVWVRSNLFTRNNAGSKLELFCTFVLLVGFAFLTPQAELTPEDTAKCPADCWGWLGEDADGLGVRGMTCTAGTAASALPAQFFTVSLPSLQPLAHLSQFANEPPDWVYELSAHPLFHTRRLFPFLKKPGAELSLAVF